MEIVWYTMDLVMQSQICMSNFTIFSSVIWVSETAFSALWGHLLAV
jgi:energy-converting hydrogenase Eha subunit F